jgi:hypothetical protein
MPNTRETPEKHKQALTLIAASEPLIFLGNFAKMRRFKFRQPPLPTHLSPSSMSILNPRLLFTIVRTCLALACASLLLSSCESDDPPPQKKQHHHHGQQQSTDPSNP